MSADCHVPPVPPPESGPPADAQAQRPDVAASRLVSTLAVAGALAGLLIVVAFQWAQPRILAHRAAVLQAAIQEVLGAPDRVETLFLAGDALSTTLPPGADSLAAERVFAGYDADGRPIGYAVLGAEAGFQDVITLIFGYDPASRQVLGMKVLDNKETPGLGDKIVKDTAFVGGFRGAVAPLLGVKAGAGSGAQQEVDMITGATISSKAVIAIINHRIERLGPALEAHAAGRAP